MLCTVTNVELSDMRVTHSGDRAIYISGYNSTIRNVSVEGNGCGGIGMSGGDQVSLHIALIRYGRYYVWQLQLV